MKRALTVLAVVAGLALTGSAMLFLKYGDFAHGVADDAQRKAVVKESDSISLDTCRYFLNVPADIDYPETPPFDTTIVRTGVCKHHVLHFPTWGTGSTYKISGNGLEREVGFMTDEKDKHWLDISNMPAGEYHVNLLACGNGGFFTLRIK